MVSDENAGALNVQGQNTIIFSVKTIFFYLLKKWWLYLIVGLLAGLGGYFYAASQKPLYKSKLTFALDDGGGGGISGFASLASQFGLNLGGSKDIFQGENILEIMKSRRMVERVLLSIDTFNNKPFTLIEYYLDLSRNKKTKNKNTAVYFPPGQPRTSFNYVQDSILKRTYLHIISENIMARKPDRKLNIYEVNFTSLNEKFSKIFTDRIVTETNLFYTEIRTKKAKETLSILEERVATMKGNLNSSISNRASVQDANVNPAFAAAQVPVLKQQANIQVYSGAYGEMFKNLEIARFQYLNEIPLMQIIDAADYPMEKIKAGKLKFAVLFAIFSGLLLTLFLWLWQRFKAN